jgi:hypothetical protein
MLGLFTGLVLPLRPTVDCAFEVEVERLNCSFRTHTVTLSICDQTEARADLAKSLADPYLDRGSEKSITVVLLRAISTWKGRP